MKNFKCICLLCLLLSFLSCTNSEKDQRTPLQDSLLQTVDDSIRLQSPHMQAMLNHGMASARDSITYYEYYLRNSFVYYLNDKIESMKVFTERTLAFAKRQSPVTKRVHGLFGMAYMLRAMQLHRLRQDADSSIFYYKLAVDNLMKSDDKEKLPNICANMADAYFVANDIPKAAFWYRRALFLSDSLHMPAASNVSINMGLAQIYTQLRDYESANTCYLNTEKHYNDLDPNMQIMFVGSYGNFFYYKKDYPNALKQFRRMKHLLESNHLLDIDYNVCEINLADVFLNLNMLDSARVYVNRCQSYFIKNKVDPAIYYTNTVKIGIALKTGNVGEAKNIIENEKVKAPAEPNMVNIRSEYMRQYYAKTGNYEGAYSALQNYMMRNDTLEQNKTHMRAAEIMLRFQQDTLALHHQIYVAAKNKEVKNAYIIVFAALAIVIICVLLWIINIIYLRRRRLQSQVKMLQLRLANVRNRISPHFIFNVLNNIIIKNEKISSDNLKAVTQFIRKGLDMSRHTFVTLKEEMDFTCLYIKTTRYIIDDDFVFNVKTPDDDTLNSIFIPSMFIQILAENSIKHALLQKQGEKRLTIDVAHNAEGTCIRVKDNGCGFSVDKSNSGTTKTGLNVLRQTIFLVNDKNREKMTFDVHNMYDANCKVIGCEAVIFIPSGMNIVERIDYE